MSETNQTNSTFLWVLRGLTSAFLLGYLVSIYLAAVVSEGFPAQTLMENLLAIGLLFLFGMAYYLMWISRELLTAILFLLWYACLWLIKVFIGGTRWEEAPVPGIIVFILAILFLVYFFRKKKT